MRKWIAVAVLACYAHVARGQCPTNSTITPNETNYILMSPYDVPGVAAILTTQAPSVVGYAPSHNLTVTPGTWIGFTWASKSGVSESNYYTTNNNTNHNTMTQFGLNGNNQNWWLMGNADVGVTYHVFFVVTDASGNTTQDMVNVTTVAGSGPSIVDQDELPNNLYYKATASFSGTSSMACGACAQNPQACSNVTHEGRISFELDNFDTGEVQTQQMIYGPLVNPTFNNGLTSNPLYLSVLPGQTTQDSQTDQVECSMYGLFYNQSPTDAGGYTHKVMKTKIKVLQQGSTTAGVTRWYVESWCKDIQHVPIWEPEYIDTKGAATILITEGQYEISMQDCKAKPGMPAWDCPPIAVTPPQPLTIGVGGTKYDCSTLINTPLPQ